MNYPRKWWQRIIDRILGRRWTMGIDPATKKGDYSAVAIGYFDSEEVFHITHISCSKEKP